MGTLLSQRPVLKNRHNVNYLGGFKVDRSAVSGYPGDKIDFIEQFIQERVLELISW